MAEAGLAKCPWCGRTPDDAFENLRDGDEDEIVKCWTVMHECPDLPYSRFVAEGVTKAEAIAAWNKRPAVDPSDASAIEALKLHVAYEAIRPDRGGHNGPKGKAWAAFIAARDAALSSRPSQPDPKREEIVRVLETVRDFVLTGGSTLATTGAIDALIAKLREPANG